MHGKQPAISTTELQQQMMKPGRYVSPPADCVQAQVRTYPPLPAKPSPAPAPKRRKVSRRDEYSDESSEEEEEDEPKKGRGSGRSSQKVSTLHWCMFKDLPYNTGAFMSPKLWASAIVPWCQGHCIHSRPLLRAAATYAIAAFQQSACISPC